MPELPDIELYHTAIHRQIDGQTLQSILTRSPFLLRTFEHDPANRVTPRDVADIAGEG